MSNNERYLGILIKRDITKTPDGFLINEYWHNGVGPIMKLYWADHINEFDKTKSQDSKKLHTDSQDPEITTRW